jgi:hypothetical protein
MQLRSGMAFELSFGVRMHFPNEFDGMQVIEMAEK